MSGPLCGPAYYIDPDPSDLVVSEQLATYVFTNEGGDVVIHQVSHDDGDVLIFICPKDASTLCRAILKAAGLDHPDSALCAVTAKDPTANDRQRRHRKKQRDSHGQQNVTVTAKRPGELDGDHEERGSAATD